MVDSSLLPPDDALGPSHRLPTHTAAFALLLRTAPAIAALIDQQGMILSTSRHWQEATGLPDNVATGRPMAELLSSDSRQWAMRDLLPELAERGRVRGMAIELSTPEGHMRLLAGGAVLHTSASGWVAALVCRVGFTRAERDIARRTLDDLSGVAGEMAGPTLNGVPSGSVSGGPEQLGQAFLETFSDIAARLTEMSRGQRDLLEALLAGHAESGSALKGIERVLTRMSDQDRGSRRDRAGE